MSLKFRSLSEFSLVTITVLLVAVALVAGFIGAKLGVRYEIYSSCCQLTPFQTIVVRAKEVLGVVRFRSEIGQDRWVSEKIFPGVKNGFFMDIGSNDGTFDSNTKALEEKGWTGICVDPFPTNMHNRTCQVFRDVVSDETGKSVAFWEGGDWGGIVDTLGGEARAVLGTGADPVAQFSTVTLGDILERAKAPHFIHFISLDIEGGELNALKGFPFDKYQIGALAVEHYFEEPKRSEIKKLMESKGYRRIHSWKQDDFYVPAKPDRVRS